LVVFEYPYVNSMRDISKELVAAIINELDSTSKNLTKVGLNAFTTTAITKEHIYYSNIQEFYWFKLELDGFDVLEISPEKENY